MKGILVAGCRPAIFMASCAAGLSLFGCAQVSYGPRAPGEVLAPAPSEGEPGCVTIERGVHGDVKDARIGAQSPDRNFGHLGTTFAGNTGRWERMVLLGFDLSVLPSGAVVEKATLHLSQATVAGGPFAVHRATKPWEENRVTWRSFGAAFDPEPEAMLWGRPGDSGGLEADVTGMVQRWVRDETGNHGLVLRPSSGGKAASVATFFSSESAAEVDRPRLVVCLTHAPLTTVPRN
ncbi:MAG: DNRLRE domain-containing protein [Polyangiaceae bacterium]